MIGKDREVHYTQVGDFGAREDTPEIHKPRLLVSTRLFLVHEHTSAQLISVAFKWRWVILGRFVVFKGLVS